MKRWEPVSNGPDDTTWMEARASGQYVLHSDVVALLAVAEAARKVVQHTADFDLETALARLDGEVGNG